MKEISTILPYCFKSYGVIRRMRVLMLFALIVAAIPAQAGEIHRAAEQGDLTKIKRLLRHNPKLLNEQDSLGRTPFHAAAISGQSKMVAYLLSKGANPYILDSDGYSALHHCLLWDSSMAALLLTYGVQPTLKTPKGESILNDVARGYWAMYNHRYTPSEELINRLLNNPADVLSRNARNQTPLHFACYYGKLELVKQLLAHGADTTVRDDRNYKPIDYTEAMSPPPALHVGWLMCGNTGKSEEQLYEEQQNRMAVGEYLRSLK